MYIFNEKIDKIIKDYSRELTEEKEDIKEALKTFINNSHINKKNISTKKIKKAYYERNSYTILRNRILARIKKGEILEPTEYAKEKYYFSRDNHGGWY